MSICEKTYHINYYPMFAIYKTISTEKTNLKTHYEDVLRLTVQS